MKIKDKVLVVEDDKNIRSFLQAILEANDYEVVLSQNGAEAYSLITSQCPDVILLDLGLPDMDGMKILETVRGWSAMPIIVVSARDRERDKVEALDKGADDYITKPFGIREMMARIKAVLRRYEAPAAETGAQKEVDTILSADGIVINVERHEVDINGKSVELTLKEFELLQYLMENRGHVFTRDQLLNHVWGIDYAGETRTVDVHIRHLRQKLSDAGADEQCIETIRGKGYKIK